MTSRRWREQGQRVLQYDYFNESLQFGKDQAGMIAVRVDDSKQSDAIAARIDAQFENSP